MAGSHKQSPKLIFVYNADSGLKNAIKDSAHKLFSPRTYQCKLCELTYSPIKEKRVWKKFRTASNYDMKFLHADEFENLYRSKFRPSFDLPVVLIENQYDLDVLISSKTFDDLKSVDQLIDKIENLIER